MDNKQIEKELRKEELKAKLTKPLLVFATIALGLFILWIASPQPPEFKSELFTATTIRQTPVSAGYGYDFAMIVKLENDEEIRIPMKTRTKFKANARVELKKITNIEDNSISYEFSRYLN